VQKFAHYREEYKRYASFNIADSGNRRHTFDVKVTEVCIAVLAQCLQQMPLLASAGDNTKMKMLPETAGHLDEGQWISGTVCGPGM
jgi:hypothetical protein